MPTCPIYNSPDFLKDIDMKHVYGARRSQDAFNASTCVDAERWLYDLQAREHDYVFEVHCSYCEVYNEVIYDLLTEESAPLDLR